MSLWNLLLSTSFAERNIKMPADGSRPLGWSAFSGQIVDNFLASFSRCLCPSQVRR